MKQHATMNCPKRPAPVTLPGSTTKMTPLMNDTQLQFSDTKKAVIAHSAVDKGYEENSHPLSENPKSFLFVSDTNDKTYICCS